jgi:FkbM family methyltransferase
LKFAFFGLLARPQETSRSVVRKVLSRVIPPMWLRPAALGGMQVLIKPTDWSQTVIFDEVFLEKNYDLESLDIAPDLILDCGAHIGLFSLMATAVYPKARIFAFEPNPNNVQFIRQQIAKNSLEIILIDSPVATEVSDRYFWQGNSHNSHLLEGENMEGIGYKVRTVDLPAMLRELNPGKLLLKLDVEGEEESILPAIAPIFPRECVVYFETHAGQAGWDKASSILTNCGFDVRQTNMRDKYADGIAIRRS